MPRPHPSPHVYLGRETFMYVNVQLFVERLRTLEQISIQFFIYTASVTV